MEQNVSKALIMAAQVFIGIIILSIFVYAFEKVSILMVQYREVSDRQNIIKFNTQFTSYITNNTDMQYIYSEDVVTIANQAIDWNELVASDNEKITVYIYNQTGGLQYEIKKKTDFSEVEFLNSYKLTDNPTNSEYQFSCEVILASETGRVKQVLIRNKGPKIT